MKLRSRRVDEPEINLISLIDVVLMLVIFFMLSSTFVEEGRLRIRLPAANATVVQDRITGPLTIAISQQGSYQLNGRELINSSPDTLRAAIAKEAGDDRSLRVIVRADARATHQSVVTAMDVLGKLGFSEIGIATVQTDASGTAPTPAGRP